MLTWLTDSQGLTVDRKSGGKKVFQNVFFFFFYFCEKFTAIIPQHVAVFCSKTGRMFLDDSWHWYALIGASLALLFRTLMWTFLPSLYHN